MYLHIGKDIAVKEEDVVGLFDLDTTSASKRGREFLHKAQKAKLTYSICARGELPKSFALVAKANTVKRRRQPKKKKLKWVDQDKIFIAQVSSSTLLKRAHTGPLFDSLVWDRAHGIMFDPDTFVEEKIE